MQHDGTRGWSLARRFSSGLAVRAALLEGHGLTKALRQLEPGVRALLGDCESARALP